MCHPKSCFIYFNWYNYILKVLITSSQWKELVIEKDHAGLPEIHYSNLHRTHERWVGDGSFDRILVSSIQLLHEHKLLDISVIHGDGTTQAAKKGGDMIGFNGHERIKGCLVIVFSDRGGNTIAPFLSAAGNRNECALFKAA